MSFWVRRSLTVFVIGFAVLFVVSLLKGRGVAGGAEFAAFWAALSTAVFIGTRLYYVRRERSCAICQDLPEERAARA